MTKQLGEDHEKHDNHSNDNNALNQPDRTGNRTGNNRSTIKQKRIAVEESRRYHGPTFLRAAEPRIQHRGFEPDSCNCVPCVGFGSR